MDPLIWWLLRAWSPISTASERVWIIHTLKHIAITIRAHTHTHTHTQTDRQREYEPAVCACWKWMELEGMSPVLPVTTVTVDACHFFLSVFSSWNTLFLRQHDYVWVCKTFALLLDTWIAYKKDVCEKGAYVQKRKGGHVGWRNGTFIH